MKILLDNCVPVKLAGAIFGHEVHTCRSMGWEDLSNGRLLAAAEAAGFSILLTVDTGIRHEQALEGRQISVVCLRAFSDSLRDLISIVPLAIEAAENLQPGSSAEIGAQQ